MGRGLSVTAKSDPRMLDLWPPELPDDKLTELKTLAIDWYYPLIEGPSLTAVSLSGRHILNLNTPPSPFVSPLYQSPFAVPQRLLRKCSNDPAHIQPDGRYDRER
jgi:hypothetical protein